ncbi:hypothetical protein F5883DRAFT_574404 [Diaporthe sp. PMI_573]|nr:hypothetical protein F5883DRAFT_574404 [Diaporthaceae sp. PMI_573]
MSDGSVDGASFCSDSLLPDAPGVDVGGEGDDGRVLKLRGGAGEAGGWESEDGTLVTSFSGTTRCHIHHAREFYAAVDAVLVLGRRLDVQITVALIRVKADKNHVPYAEAVHLERGTLGHVTSEEDLHNRLLSAHTQASQDSPEDGLRLFVCHRSNEKALLELQAKGSNAQTACLPAPIPEYFQFAGADSSSWRSYAYLWMPQDVTEHTASSLYAKWFKTVVRIASGPQDLTGKLGRHSAQLPKVPYAVQVYVDGTRTPPFHSESPLPREVWEAIVRSGRRPFTTNPTNHFILSLTSLQGHAFAQVPGYYPPPAQTERPELDTKAVFRLAWDSVPTHDRDSVASMVIRRPGHLGTVTFKCKNGDVDRTTNDYPAAEGQLRDWLNRKYFFTIVPQWDTYEAIIPSSSDTIQIPADWEWSKVRPRLLAGLGRAGSDFDDDNILRIDQRTAHGKEARGALQRNRVAWDMDLGTGGRADTKWKEFMAVLSVKRFIISVEPKYLENGRASVVNPLASDHQSALWARWGCNRPSAHVDTGEPAEESTRTGATATQRHMNPNSHNGPPARAQDQDQGLLHQGVPQLGAGVDMFQSGKYYREQSFATPLSVQLGDQKPRFPINAPPIEHIRRPRGPDGIESDSMPIVSTHIMTPTEQRTLQQAFFQMRSIALNRAQQCPHKDCAAFFPVGPDNMAAFHKHLEDRHIGSHCPFCDETLFKYWSASDKQKHFVDNHSEYFTAKGDLLRETLLADRIKSKGNVHRREEQYNFCPRCGRNHQLLSSKADRVHHDNACFPGNETTLPTEQYCPCCGKPDYVLVGFRNTRRREQHQCAAAAAATDPNHPTPASNIFCQHCALECHQLPVSYGRRHLLSCKALASRPDNWCPWCGVDLKSGPRAARLKHLAICILKPASGQNPVCTDSGIPLDSPRDLQAHRLRHGLTDLGTTNRKTRIAVPPKCPVGGCDADLTSWNAQGLYDHFQSHPENVLEEGGGLKSCPFCKCNFETRGWHTRLEKQQHFDDHVHFEQRARRVLNDEIIGSNSDRESAPVLQAIATRDYDQFDHTAETENLNAQIVRLSETVKRLADENRKCRDAQRKSSKKDLQRPITPSSPGVTRRAASRASRPSPAGGEPPAKKSRAVPGFATGRQVFRGVHDASEDWGEEEGNEEDEFALESDVDVEDEIIDDKDFDDDIEDDYYDELADEA